MNNIISKKINSTLKFVYSDNNSLSVIFHDNDLLMGVVGEFNDNLKLGTNYRTNNTLSPLLHLKFNNLEIGYAYEFSLKNTLIGLGVKTHEVFLKFNIENSNNGESIEEPSE